MTAYVMGDEAPPLPDQPEGLGLTAVWSTGEDRSRRGASKAASLLSGIAGAVWLSNVLAVVSAYSR